MNLLRGFFSESCYKKLIADNLFPPVMPGLPNDHFNFLSVYQAFLPDIFEWHYRQDK